MILEETKVGPSERKTILLFRLIFTSKVYVKYVSLYSKYSLALYDSNLSLTQRLFSGAMANISLISNSLKFFVFGRYSKNRVFTVQ